MEKTYDFSGWATKANLKCSDGRVILKDAFKHCDGQTVPLCWGHQHNDPTRVLGHALLENREQGVYTYCSFNDTEAGQHAKEMVRHGDIIALSIYANKLKQDGCNVLHGAIREVSLVLAGANPGAFIDSVIVHGEESESEAIIYTGEDIKLAHGEDENAEEEETSEVDEMNNTETDESEAEETDEEVEESVEHAENSEESKADNKTKTVGDVLDTLNPEQQEVVFALLGKALKSSESEENKENKENNQGEKEMKQNAFDNKENKSNVLSHADQESIIALAKSTSVGSFRAAMETYAEQNKELAHAFTDEAMNNYLFPDYKDVKPGAPELLTRDYGWVDHVISKIHKSPISRIRTRQADARIAELRAAGYKKGEEKKLSSNISVISRTTDPQTIYIKDSLNRDDIIDITDFDVPEYQYKVMSGLLKEEVALAALIGDGREPGGEGKIEETHVRSIWNDDELYTIHADVDVAKAKAELQGSNTGANFGDNYVYAEAIITAALYAREKYKGSGSLDFYCTPHLLNVMLLARDLNGRRIYESKADLAAALNVNNIFTIEQFEGKKRTAKDGKEKKLLGIFVNLADYQFGSTKGGEITRFNQFDIDFNKEKYLIETRLSGALTKVLSAIALEEPVVAE